MFCLCVRVCVCPRAPVAPMLTQVGERCFMEQTPWMSRTEKCVVYLELEPRGPMLSRAEDVGVDFLNRILKETDQSELGSSRAPNE